MTVAPNPVGVNQRVMIVVGFPLPTRSAYDTFYEDWIISITNPAGETTDIGPYNTESTGVFATSYVPDMVGTWQFQAHYPGGSVDLLGVDAYVPPADTEIFTLIVQEEPIPSYPGAEPPTEYWEFPIYAENREWATLGGSWLMPGGISGGRSTIYAAAFNPYTTVPNTGHILWTKPLLIGGIIGGATENTYYAGSSYRPELVPPVIIGGRLYYIAREIPRHGFYCVDLHTGDTIWHKNATYPDGEGGIIESGAAQISLGQILNIDTRNWHGGVAFLWSTGATTWAVWDAFTGNLAYTIVNAPRINTLSEGVTFYTDPNTGALITFVYDRATDTFTKWNSTKMFDQELPRRGGGGLERWCFESAPRFNFNWTSGIEWSVTIPRLTWNLEEAEPGTGAPGSYWSRSKWIHDRNDPSVIIMTNHTRGSPLFAQAFEDMAISGEDGSILWRKVRDEGTWEEISGGFAMSVENDAYVLMRKETKQLYAYSVSTGDKLWESEPRESFWGIYPRGPAFAYDKAIWGSYDGIIQAHDARTGQLEWEWGPVDAGLETPYGHYPFIGCITVADGKIMIPTNEHSADVPLYRGEKMYVIDADSGETLWSALGWWQWPIAAGGYVLGPNGYDGKIYTFGKGPSSTSVSVPEIILPLGTNTLITGTVTDISPGTEQSALKLRFPKGVPAVSDESMTPWMEHLYMQKPCPENVTGVPVELRIVHPNGEIEWITTVTSDGYGNFAYVYGPLSEGIHRVIATFPGSESYWSSYAEAAFAVGPSSGFSSLIEPNQPEPEIPDASSAHTQTIILAAVAIFFAAVTVSIIGVAAYWLMKRK
jgi:hypothetical protein